VPRLVVVGNITADPHDDRYRNATYWNSTVPGLGSTAYASGLQDFSVRKQQNRTAFAFVA
jgi:hypothetical protein